MTELTTRPANNVFPKGKVNLGFFTVIAKITVKNPYKNSYKNSAEKKPG